MLIIYCQKHNRPAIIRKTPAEFQIFLDKPFWGGIAGDRLELIDQSSLMFILIMNQDSMKDDVKAEINVDEVAKNLLMKLKIKRHCFLKI